MRLLFVGNTAASMWNFRKEVMLALKSEGHFITVVVPHDSSVNKIQEYFPVEIVSSLERKGKSVYRDFLFFIELVRIYKKCNPDLIIHYTIKPNIYGSLASFFCGKKAYIVVAGLGYAFTRASFLRLCLSILYRVAVSVSKKIIFLNVEDMQDFENMHILPKNSKKAFFLPGEGVDVNWFCPVRSVRFQEKGAGTFLFVGRLLLDKGIRYFLKTAKEIRSLYPLTKFIVVGDIDEGNPTSLSKEELKTYIVSGDIEFIGHVNDVKPYFAMADALVFPTFYGEGLARVVLESLAMGVPVITTDNRGCTPLVKDSETGFIIPKNELHLLSRVIEKFLQLSSSERKIIGIRGTAAVKTKYTTEHVISIYEKLIQQEMRP
jgi:glycosyltransferase involved in cell wall biosynthesis